MKSTSLLLFFLFSIMGFSQTSSLKENDWDTSFVFHGGMGVQKSVYAEFGVSRFNLIMDGWVALSKGHFASIEVTPALQSGENHIYGFKVGCEYSVLLATVAVECKYQTDLQTNDIVLTPKIGLGAWGTVTAFYGYNISAHNEPFSRIGEHQFSLICNLVKY